MADLAQVEPAVIEAQNGLVFSLILSRLFIAKECFYLRLAALGTSLRTNTKDVRVVCPILLK